MSSLLVDTDKTTLANNKVKNNGTYTTIVNRDKTTVKISNFVIISDVMQLTKRQSCVGEQSFCKSVKPIPPTNDKGGTGGRKDDDDDVALTKQQSCGGEWGFCKSVKPVSPTNDKSGTGSCKNGVLFFANKWNEVRRGKEK